MSSDRPVEESADQRSTRRRPAGSQLLFEVVLGLVVAVLLVLVGWASSNAIRFVYGGY